jgi:Cu(I)/Ag(I) efflux system membrane fusion protein
MRYFLIIMMLFASSFAKEATLKQLFNVQTIKVKELSSAKSMKSFGFVKADQSRIYDVSPRFSGFVEVLYADKIYKEVKKGEVLAKVYSPEVLKAKEDYLNTINYTHSRPNQAMLSSAKTKLELLNISSSEITAIQREQKSSNYTDIFSPADGFIFKKELNNNSAFSANKKVFEIINLDKVWVEVKIHQEQLKELQMIDNFTLTTPAYAQTFKAKKVQLYPQLDEKEEAFTLRLEVENKNHFLLPGMYTSVEMSSKNRSYLTLPATALMRKNSKFYVFSVGEYEGEYEPKEVEVEALTPDTYIIKSGLNAGDSVVSNALFMMDSDAQINGLY